MVTTFDKLFEPVRIGAWNLRTRTVMAPMTRCFADDKTGVVGPHVVEYYRKRAVDGIGLIITEGIVISPRAKGNPGVPGLYTKEQVESWKPVTEAVHKEGGTIIAQIWHVGRASHHELTGGLPPQSASAIRAEGFVPRFRKPYDTPEEMTQEDIREVVAQYAQAAKNAIEAGFDGVEIHGAHGYLIDQFNSDVSNRRSDAYGGDLAQRLTFMKEVLTAVIDSVGVDRTLIRFSALKIDNLDYMWEDPEKAIQTFVDAFRETGVTMIHPSTMDFGQVLADGQTMHQLVRKHWDGIMVGVGGLDTETAETALREGIIDLAAFGRPLIANPDYLSKVKKGEPPLPYNAKQQLATLV
ncbi:2,4-dienoyl-CoA reductase-like NADH-dependent reductase (Old Yellow Enzyme family) [Desmospora profundinema]|uniref:2,4-dienoyl-CoA reductase-like NADH-dependent reductase (Old Yellow Enzyme family) n=1 Tax=Desmospora profundinema TaxID=1571184 RepID=A0ABU1IP07_9BACL|nr:2,4-dienoyl-CoA reductase-like NADH-dependent reductase (Old Yellow Enzyme family) [Desmospora profundinema]